MPFEPSARLKNQDNFFPFTIRHPLTAQSYRLAAETEAERIAVSSHPMGCGLVVVGAVGWGLWAGGCGPCAGSVWCEAEAEYAHV